MAWRWRAPSLLAWLLLLAGLVLFVSAGRWQYGKAELKRERQLAFDAIATAPARPFTEDMLDKAGGFDRVTLRGNFLAQRYLLDNQVRDGRAGVEVFAPLRIDGGTTLLVALGWLAYADGRRALPPLPPVVDPGGEEPALIGTLAPAPASGLRLGRNWREQPGDSKLMPYFDREEIAADAGVPLASRVLRLDPVADTDWRRDWRPVEGMPPARHLAYAWQWWSLAIAIVVVFVVVHGRRGKRT